ncbi:MAG: OmpA family protein [Acidobacteria bacterium]|nr:OmpA family protein [Acidobacteriota bacterium]
MRKNRILFLLVLSAVALLVASGCATKKFVRQEISTSEANTNQAIEKTRTELSSQINELSDLNKQMNSRLEQVADRAAAADAKAEEAKNIGNDAKVMAQNAAKDTSKLRMDFEARNNYVAVETKMVYFDFDRFNLRDDAKAVLDEVAKLTAGNKNYILVLEGYADYIGSAAYNYTLSEKRVKSVIRYLVGDKSVDLNRIYNIGLGESNPIADNKTNEGRQQNRRVTINIMEPK